jgi:hypothetical protein
MIAKQSIGSSFMGALSYNMKKMHNQEKEGRAELLATNFISLEKSVVKKEVNLVASLNPRLKKNTYHTSLNFAQGENVSNEKMLAVAREYMEQMGFDDNPYFIFRHHDSNHPHCHILGLRIRFDGSTVSDSNNYKRSEKIVRQLERKYGLQQSVASDRSILRAPDKDELEMVQRTGRASRKMVLQEKVNTALLQSSTLKTFITHLEQAGVQVLFNQASTGRVSGITYFMGTSRPKARHWATILNGQTSLKHWIMSKLETARKLARQTAERGKNMEKAARTDPKALDQIVGTLEVILHNQTVLDNYQEEMLDGLKKKLSPLDKLEQRTTTMEGTIAKLVNQQEKARRLLMTIFFTGIVPLLAFITALV